MFPYTHGVIASSSAGTVAPSTDFIIRVKTDNAGTSNNDQFTLPVRSGFTYNYTVNWGDGVTETYVGVAGVDIPANITHTYSVAGTYDITISGTFPAIIFNNGGDKLKLIRTLNFGTVGWTNLYRAFWGCTNNVIDPSCTGNFDLVTDARRGWSDNTSNDFFPAIGFPICTLISEGFNAGCWYNNNLDVFLCDDLSSATNLDFCFKNNGAISNFALRNFYSMTSGSSLFVGTTLSTSDYSDILITQNANNANTGVTFHGGSSTYNSSATIARTNLVSVKTWTITDGGLV